MNKINGDDAEVLRKTLGKESGAATPMYRAGAASTAGGKPILSAISLFGFFCKSGNPL